MTISRWKVMACTLGLSLGGLAVCAGQSNDKLGSPTTPSPQTTEPAPLVLPVATKPAPVPAAPETLPPAVAPVMIELETPKEIVPVVAPPAPAVSPEVIGEPTAPQAEAPPKTRDTEPLRKPEPPIVSDPPAEPTKAPAPPAAPTRVEDLPVPMDIEITKPIPPVAPPAPLKNSVASPPPDRGPTSPPMVTDPLNVSPSTRPGPVPPMVLTPAPYPQPSPPAPPVPSASQATGKLKMLLRLGDGKPRFEIRDTAGADMLLKVYGEKIEMQSAPNDGKKSAIEGVTAVGKVRFVGPGIEGTCDQLSVLSGTGEVMLKGNVLLKTKRGKTWSEMSAEKMIYQIGSSGLTVPASRPLTPAVFQTTP
jgi:hypothetical protein